MATVHPYLTFNGKCQEAFDFYKSIFQSEFKQVVKFSEMPGEAEQHDADPNLIMHISLPLDQGTILMGSDRPASMGEGSFGNNYSISIGSENLEEAIRIFRELSADGTVTMPFEKAFWGEHFGMLTDKYDVQWLLSCAAE